MIHRPRPAPALLLMLLATACALQACSKAADGAHAAAVKHASMTPEGEGIQRITLSDLAVKRLRFEYAEAKKSGDRLSLPYNTLLYDPKGKEWVYLGLTPNSFKRAALKVAAIEGDTVYYTDGPAEGTKVVTWGAVELSGIEYGIGK